MAEKNTNLWAPWRAEYIRSLGSGDAPPCFLCAYAADPSGDRANHVVHRGDSVFVVMNRYPYTNGHLLIAPRRHGATLADHGDGVLLEIMQLARTAMAILEGQVQPDGFNFGINLGRCAGAGLPGHVHAHVVPRWSGDTNFMAAVGDVRMVPEDIDQLWARLAEGFKSEHGSARSAGE